MLGNLVEHVKISLEKSMTLNSKLTPAAQKIPGMTSLQIRHLLNNICSIEGAKYLEVGCWRGASAVAAAYANKGYFYGIDNFSEFNGNEVFLHKNITKFPETEHFNFTNLDCWDIPSVEIFTGKDINVFFYDGPHTEEDHIKAITMYQHLLAEKFVLVIDDWNWPQVQIGTRKAISWLGMNIEFKEEFFCTENDANSWWNGIFVGVVSKS